MLSSLEITYWKMAFGSMKLLEIGKKDMVLASICLWIRSFFKGI